MSSSIRDTISPPTETILLLLPPQFYNQKTPPTLAKWDSLVALIDETLQKITSDSFITSSIVYNLTNSFQLKLLGSSTETNLLNFLESLEPTLVKTFCKSAVPSMLLSIKNTLPKIYGGNPLPYLNEGRSHNVTLSELECFALLSAGFFSLYPEQNSRRPVQNPYDTMPGLNFQHLFDTSPEPHLVAKLEALVRYFVQQATYLEELIKGLHTERNIRMIQFHRIVKDPEGVDWWTSAKDFSFSSASVKLFNAGHFIEDSPHLQANFANRYLGGGVLGYGCVQEEILYTIYPELLVSRLLFAPLQDDEVGLISGAKKFTSYKGYAKGFRCTGSLPHDEQQLNSLLCIDALCFSTYDAAEQFDEHNILRELNKLAVGLSVRDSDFSQHREGRMAFATGNWGCGVFGGDCQFKFILQWIASTMSKRDLHYHTFGREELNMVPSVVKLLENVQCARLLQLLLKPPSGYTLEIGKVFSTLQRLINDGWLT